MTLKVGDRVLCSPSIVKYITGGIPVIDYKMTNGAKCHRGELTPVIGDPIELWGVQVDGETYPYQCRTTAEKSALIFGGIVVRLVAYIVAETDGAT